MCFVHFWTCLTPKCIWLWQRKWVRSKLFFLIRFTLQPSSALFPFMWMWLRRTLCWEGDETEGRGFKHVLTLEINNLCPIVIWTVIGTRIANTPTEQTEKLERDVWTAIYDGCSTDGRWGRMTFLVDGPGPSVYPDGEKLNPGVASHRPKINSRWIVDVHVKAKQ